MSEQDRQDPIVTGPKRERDEDVSLGHEVTGPSVGERIRQGREAAGLSAADLAQPLNLDLKVIERIERDELDAVPGRPYILAYLRAWARQMDLDGDALVAQYNAQRAPADESVQGGIHPTLDVMEPRRGGAARRLFAWLIVLLLVALAVVGLSRLDTDSLRALIGDWGNPTAGEVPPESTNPSTDDRPAIEGGLEQPPKPPRAPTVEGAPASGASLGDLPDQRLTAIGAPVAEEQKEAAAGEPEGSSESTATASPAAPTLVLRATEGDSWVEVRDGNDERLMYDVLAAGEERAFTDVTGPVSLVLGNPRGFEVEYRGEPVDLGEADTATGVLRTTVGNS
ncbi:MAG: DUF4115 domain-containing protein [Halothiobacillaceae bacterium]|nr:DUF4115 domain-containing protein [Halothiobacillaceae bacterium]HER34237.1 helix-turn-helix domain-containing protein [Halothiobacillaceae bacterium]